MRTIPILIALLLFSGLQLKATIYRVNNNVGVSANFANFTAAYNVAVNNDTLYFEGSNTTYGNITIAKPLVIIGPGYFLTENPQTQVNLITSKFGTISINLGASGAKIIGFDITGTITIACSNFSITHCRIVSNLNINSTASVSNILIAQNYITGRIINSTGTAQVTNVLISNNYIYTAGSWDCIALPIGYSGVISNNVLKVGSNTYAIGVSNFIVNNNIVLGGNVDLNNNSFYNNICNATQFPAINNNQQNVNMSFVFVGVTGNSTDGQYILAPGSPAIGAGVDGTDCGMFGGLTPYVLSGLPSIPAIYEVIMPASGTTLNGINVNVKAKIH